jgi:polyisoprenoid-binding protein YceI
MKLIARYLVLVLVLLAAVPAYAKEWTIDYKNSKLTFTGTQTGQPFTGAFSAYVAKIDFDPKKPEEGKIEVQIDMRTAKTGDAQRDDALPQPEWFDSKNIQYAEFASSAIKGVSDRMFDMTGYLKIKHTTKEVRIPFSLEKVNDGLRAKGQLTINRGDFGVGTGEWASDKFVGQPVTIALDIMAY